MRTPLTADSNETAFERLLGDDGEIVIDYVNKKLYLDRQVYAVIDVNEFEFRKSNRFDFKKDSDVVQIFEYLVDAVNWLSYRTRVFRAKVVLGVARYKDGVLKPRISKIEILSEFKECKLPKIIDRRLKR